MPSMFFSLKKAISPYRTSYYNFFHITSQLKKTPKYAILKIQKRLTSPNSTKGWRKEIYIALIKAKI